jgi:hypothetical protein
MMGSPHPKARGAASQEGYAHGPELLDALKALRYGRRNIHKIWRRNGLFPATLHFAGLRPRITLARPLNSGGLAAAATESRKRDLFPGPSLA